MSELADSNVSGLDKLTISHGQRPTAQPRTWLTLAAILGVVGLLGVAAAWWYYRTTGVQIAGAFAERPVDVRLLVVPGNDAGPSQVVLVATGKIVSDCQVNVATKISGQIVALGVEQGDAVVKDQVLARVEDVVYRAQRDEAAALATRRRHEAVRARSELARAEAAVAQAAANDEFETRNDERLRRLRETNQASDFETDNARNKHEAAEAALHVAQAEAKAAATWIDVCQAEAAAAEATLRMMQQRLDDCAIRAPIAGVILERNAQVGDFLAAEGGRGANANAQLVKIADMSLLRVEIDVSERDVQRIGPGQPARITPDADPRGAYGGAVMWVDPIGNYAKATVQVKVRIHDPGPNLRVDGSAKVEFLQTAAADQAPAGIWLPKQAVQLQPGSDQALVFTVADSRAVANPVTVGARTEQSVEIRTGVQAGLHIIAEDAASLHDDTLVNVVHAVPK